MTVAHAETTAVDQGPKPKPSTHVVSMPVLLAVIVALLALTAVTVAVAGLNLGPGAGVVVAVGIATLKAALVVLYFMHLRYESSFHASVLACALLFVALFIMFALKDTQEYRPDLIPPVGQTSSNASRS